MLFGGGMGANTCYFGGVLEGDISQFKICPLQVWAVVYTLSMCLFTLPLHAGYFNNCPRPLSLPLPRTNTPRGLKSTGRMSKSGIS